MLNNYLKLAWRSLVRNKKSSAINIFGLALGISTSLLILLWVQDEQAVDAFHASSPRLFQVYERTIRDGKVEAGYATQGLLAQELKRVIPDVQYTAAFDYAAAPGTKNTLQVDDKINKITGFFAGEDFFRMFSFPLLEGTSETALRAPGDIAISRSAAQYFFGSPGAAIGQTIRYENKETLRVTAVFENVPTHSSLQFDFLRSWADYVKQNDWVDNWTNMSPSSFIQLRPGANRAVVETKIKDFLSGYTQKIKGYRNELLLQPFAEKYLHSTFKDGVLDGGRIEYVRLFTGVAIFILLIACVNFMNLATAQSVKRAREVGLRKVVGATRFSLVLQFIGEAILLTGFAILAALVLTSAVLPPFNEVTGKQLFLPFSNPAFICAILAIGVATALVAGSYPAFFLSSFQPVKVLRGIHGFRTRSSVAKQPGRSSQKFNWTETLLRKGLVVFQFTLSIILIVGTIVVQRQVNYIQTKNLGYDREGLVYIPIEGDLTQKYALFKEEALKLTGITDISKMRNSPTASEHHTGDIGWPGKDPNLHLSFADGVVGYDFVKTMKLQMKEGKDFSPAFSTDSVGFLLNESAVNSIGLQHPVGSTLFWGSRRGTVIGVLKDFHFNSLHQTIDPLVIRLDENWGWGTILVRIRTDNIREALTGLENLYKEINPNFPFTYQFSDLEFARQYKSEMVVGRLANGFAFLAILISCLGLFGLATFTAAQRTKEIGVRKVLGATTPAIVFLLTGDFIKIIFIAILVGSPIAWLIMHQWLQQYAYKVGIEWWMFAVAGVVTLFIALLTICYQTIQAALLNPVKSLKSE
jgi:putative ABC transport system permease protein